jgi:cysteine desulfurase
VICQQFLLQLKGMKKNSPRMIENTKKHKRIYLDYAASTPVRKEVRSLAFELLNAHHANPSSIHSEGVAARARIDAARERSARVLGASSHEIYFTSNATEALNIAITGVVRAAKKNVAHPHVITSTIEHPAILETVRALKGEGVEVTELIPDTTGCIRASDIGESLKKETVLLAFSLVNAGMGTLFSVEGCAKELRRFRKKNAAHNAHPYLLLDATQAPLYFPLNVQKLHADLLVLDGGKIGGLVGSGLLYLRRGVHIEPILFGGGQERGLRPGTENLLGIETFATALFLAQSEATALAKTVGALSQLFTRRVLESVPNAKRNGTEKNSTPHIVSICFPGIDAEWLVIYLDAHGIRVSRGSACKDASKDDRNAPHSRNPECSRSSVRFSFGKETTLEEIETTVGILKEFMNR